MVFYSSAVCQLSSMIYNKISNVNRISYILTFPFPVYYHTLITTRHHSITMDDDSKCNLIQKKYALSILRVIEFYITSDLLRIQIIYCIYLQVVSLTAPRGPIEIIKIYMNQYWDLISIFSNVFCIFLLISSVTYSQNVSLSCIWRKMRSAVY